MLFRSVELTLPPVFATFFLRLYFAQAGLEIREVTIEMVQSLEAEIRRISAGVHDADPSLPAD